MLEIIKIPITQAQFVERVQTLSPGKFSAPSLKIIFDYLEHRAFLGEAEIHLPDLCKDFAFQESSPSQCSRAVRQFLKVNPNADSDAVRSLVQSDLGEQLIGITSENTVIWWNG